MSKAGSPGGYLFGRFAMNFYTGCLNSDVCIGSGAYTGDFGRIRYGQYIADTLDQLPFPLRIEIVPAPNFFTASYMA